MNNTILNINYIIDGTLTTIPTNMFYTQSISEELQNIYFELTIYNNLIKSKAQSNIEYAVKHLQKSLPSNITLACCHSCRHGNFCPFGDSDNEIFCFKDKTFNNKNDVYEFFEVISTFKENRSKNLLDFCHEYEPISHGKYYTYNDWGLEL